MTVPAVSGETLLGALERARRDLRLTALRDSGPERRRGAVLALRAVEDAIRLTRGGGAPVPRRLARGGTS